MPSWEDRYAEHGLWESVESLGKLVQEIEAPEDENAQDTLQYATAMWGLLGQRRMATSALHVSQSMLDSTATAVDNLRAYLEGWSQGTHTDVQVDAQTEAVAVALSSWPALSSSELAAAQRDASERISAAVTEALEVVSHKRKEVTEALAQLATKQTELDANITQQTATIAGAVASFQADAKDELAQVNSSWDEERETQKQRAEGNLEVLRDLEQQARDLVHAATGSVVATDYGEYARKESRAGWICDVAAALVGSIGVAAILYHLFQAEPTADGSVGLSLTRLAASIGALGVAALVGKRGNQHHREARAAKRTDLAIRQVGPFVSNLSKDERELVVKEVTDRIFIKGELDRAAPREDLVDKISRLRQSSAEVQ